MSYVVALDQGTTSSRALVFDEAGSVLAVAQQEFRQIFPRPGWVEHDANEIWSTQADVLNEVVDRAGVKAADVAAIGVTNQRETTVIWDRATGEPIANAIVWQDRRTAGACDQLKAAGREALFRDRTGLEVDAYFSGTKVAWILDNIDGARARAERGELAFGTIDTWLLWRLTGGAVHATDASNASRTMLYNIHDGAWDEELLGVLGIPAAILPEVKQSSEVFGEVVTPPALAGVPIAGVLGDQQAATMGQVCIEPGMAKNTYGTGCFLLMNTGDEPHSSSQRLLTTVAWRMNQRTTYALEGSVFVGGAIVQWLRDGLGVIDQSPDVEALARSVEDNGGVYFVPALAGLGAPYWDPYARGAVFGISRGTTAGHIARAAIEGIAHQVADLVEAMEADAGAGIPSLRADGGAAVNDLLLQFQADILQTPVVRPSVLETTALGAAYMAGLAVGFWGSIEEIASHWRVDRTFEPSITAERAADLRGRWREAVKRAGGWESSESC